MAKTKPNPLPPEWVEVLPREYRHEPTGCYVRWEETSWIAVYRIGIRSRPVPNPKRPGIARFRTVTEAAAAALHWREQMMAEL